MSEAASQWMSVAEAAGVSGVSARTLWRWIRDGVVESRHEKRGQQSTRLVNRESLPDGQSQEVSEPVRAPASEGVGDRPDMTEVGVGCQGLNGHRRDVSPGAAIFPEERADDRQAGQSEDTHAHDDRQAGHWQVRAESAEQRLDQALSEVEPLRAQIDAHTDAEQELRVMLARLECTNAELAGALVQKALPPISTSVEMPARKVRWWWPWSR
jgi:hypothetical protein